MGVQIYPNFTKPKGLGIIFNNRRFNGVMPERHGTDVDAANAKNLFTKLGYEIKVKVDHSAEVRSTTETENIWGRELVGTWKDMRAAIARFALKDHSKYDSAVVVILTHGQHGQLYGSDGRLVGVDELTSSLDARHCRKLIKKPKLFFIQACRGGEAKCGQWQSPEGGALFPEAYDSGVHHTDGQCVGKGQGDEGEALSPLQILQHLAAEDEADALEMRFEISSCEVEDGGKLVFEGRVSRRTRTSSSPTRRRRAL